MLCLGNVIIYIFRFMYIFNEKYEYKLCIIYGKFIDIICFCEGYYLKIVNYLEVKLIVFKLIVFKLIYKFILQC